MSANSPRAEILLPDSLSDTFESLGTRLQENRIVERIWERDHTVWRKDPTEIDNRLGWLDLPEAFREKTTALGGELGFATGGAFRDVVLLGMGGSSLCPLVFAESIGPQPGSPNLHVLDTTVPSAVARVSETVDLDRTLFLVASKSGATIEVTSCMETFLGAVSQVASDPGSHFLAITDPGKGLAKFATKNGFAKVFENPPDIGGRFSALSYFGMVPATLLGLDTDKIFDLALDLAARCKPTASGDNPGAELGVFLAVCCEKGRDKLTVVADSEIESLGLWIEQLIAESTGKKRKGILPIAQEPLVNPSDYSGDRAFAVVTMGGDDSLPSFAKNLREAGHPVVVIEIDDPLELGAEFFRWEFATAVVSHFLGINPFDQPDVEESKRLSRAILDEETPREPDSLTFLELMDRIKPGDYFAILAYLEETAETNSALRELRQSVLKSKGVATTLGYGPRFQHSTGQYHKGGPNKGVFLQLVEEDSVDVPIPGQDYGFSKLCGSQALGDYQALVKKGRRVARVKVGKNPVEKIQELRAQV